MNIPTRTFYSLLLVTFLTIIFLQVVHAGEEASPLIKPDYNVISGDWQRTDGSYLLRVSEVQEGGQAKVEYFNPSPIHVAENSISIQKKLIKLFIKFQDKGYEGSTYTLYYYAAKDALVGFYYQAAIGKTFEVIFARKSP